MQLRFINHIYDHEHDGLIYHGTFLNQSMKNFQRVEQWLGCNVAHGSFEKYGTISEHPNRIRYYNLIELLLIRC